MVLLYHYPDRDFGCIIMRKRKKRKLPRKKNRDVKKRERERRKRRKNWKGSVKGEKQGIMQEEEEDEEEEEGGGGEEEEGEGGGEEELVGDDTENKNQALPQRVQIVILIKVLMVTPVAALFVDCRRKKRMMTSGSNVTTVIYGIMLCVLM